MEPTNDWLHDLLVSVQLELFYSAIRDQLQISRLAHFDYVHADDLEKIGISKPGIRRLFDAVRKAKFQNWNRKVWRKLFGASSAFADVKYNIVTPRPPSEQRTCIILEKDLTLFNELGTGSFGVVRRGEWRVPDEPNQLIQVAVKVLKADAFSQPGVYKDFHREVESMHSLRHPNLVKLYGIVVHPLMMICELATMGALLDYLRSQNGKISLLLISKWSEQVAAGMAYLESNRFLHRDLACRNILLASLEMVKIGDFGLMRALPDSNDCYVMSERRRVPFPWCAPESLRNRQFSHASDVWMFAVSLWEMYTFGEDPWMGLNGSEILRLIMRDGQRLAAPNACPPDVYMLMTKCWELDPKERPSFEGILKYMQMYKFPFGYATRDYVKDGQTKSKKDDELVLIDIREELRMWKVQNQRTLEIDLYPADLIKVMIQDQKDKKKIHTFAGFGKNDKVRPSIPRSLEDLDLPVHLRKSSTIESTQASSTRSGNPTGNKHFNYNKLVNDRTQAMRERSKRDKNTKSLGPAKTDLLIDLDLPPSTRSSLQPKKKETQNNVSILDEPIDVAQCSHDWESHPDSLPTINTSNTQNLFTTKSLDNLAKFGHTSARMSTPQPSTTFDPFDLAEDWPIDTNHQSLTRRPNYEIPIIPIDTQISNESHNYTSNSDTNNAPSNGIYANVSVPWYDQSPLRKTLVFNNTDLYSSIYTPGIRNAGISYDGSQIEITSDIILSEQPLPNNTNNTTISIYSNNLPYNYTQSHNNIYENTSNSQNLDQSLARQLAVLSLDDRISASLNLSLNNLNQNLNANSAIYRETSNSINATEMSRSLSQDVSAPEHSNHSSTRNQQQLSKTKYYAKPSAMNNASTNYENNIYVPKDSSEKLSNFSDNVENSKNYSAMKYSDSYDYWSDGSFSTYSRSDRPYDSVNDTGSNVYSEIDDANYTNTRLYDEVYEPRPRPHRPAPPCPTNK